VDAVELLREKIRPSAGQPGPTRSTPHQWGLLVLLQRVPQQWIFFGFLTIFLVLKESNSHCSAGQTGLTCCRPHQRHLLVLLQRLPEAAALFLS
jgi:hypothetical protein